VGLARAARAALRAADTLGRVGGEEFLFLCPYADLPVAEAVAERVRAAVEHEPIRYGGVPTPLAVSIGVAVVAADRPADLAALRELAARCLAEAKEGGRNRYVVRAMD
jgi:diguanylate cyclase (GGDEF)-like protein